MKKRYYKLLIIGSIMSSLLLSEANAQQPGSANTSSSSFQSSTLAPKIGIVSTKKCIEESKLGKQEQVNFEKMKNQMQAILQDKEKALEEIENKESDEDWVESVSEETLLELGRKKRAIRKEGVQLQNQYYETLQKTQVKMLQKLTDLITAACDEVAKEGNFDLLLTDEACTFYNKKLDISPLVIAKMNALLDSGTVK